MSKLAFFPSFPPDHLFNLQHMMDRLFTQLNDVYPMPKGMPKELEGWLRRSAQIRRLDKKDFLTMPGKVNRNVYFIERGLLRIYHRTGGKDISFAFAREGDL